MTQPLLHQEFTLNELAGLWTAGSLATKHKLEMQLDASRQIIQAIEEEMIRITSLEADITEASELWSQLSEHCQAIQLATNGAVSHNYAQSNTMLKKSVEQLVGKLRLIQKRYENEFTSLNQSQDHNPHQH